MRVRNEECFVLRTIPISESSFVVDLFTRNYGRNSLMAKGARRKKSAFRGAIRPFQLSQVSWSGKGDLPIMTSLVSKSAPTSIGGRQIYCSYYLNELMIRFLRQSAPYKELFDIYRESLDKLADPENEFHTLRVFEKNMLKYFGYELILDMEADEKNAVHPDGDYRYDFESGPVRVTHSSLDTIRGTTLVSIAEEKFDSNSTRKESRQFLRRAIEHYLEGRADRSREVFRQTIEVGR